MHTKNQNIIISGGSKGLGLHLVKELLNQANYVSTFARPIAADIKKLQISYASIMLNEISYNLLRYSVRYSFWGYLSEYLIV